MCSSLETQRRNQIGTRRAAKPKLLLLRSGRYQLPSLGAVLGVRVILPNGPTKIPGVGLLLLWLWLQNRDWGCHVDRRRLFIDDRWCNVNGLWRWCALLTCSCANHGPGKSQEQEWGNPARVTLPILVTTMLTLWVIPTWPVRKSTARHRCAEHGNHQRFVNFFHNKSDMCHAYLTPKRTWR
jgi:hypothetical protein